jgi:queuine tRNA-ribosyltransferase
MNHRPLNPQHYGVLRLGGLVICIYKNLNREVVVFNIKVSVLDYNSMNEQIKKPISFKIEKKLTGSLGRVGTITTPHGEIKTPAFVTVGTKATVKGITPEMLRDIGAQMALCNTYHLYLQPGEAVIKSAGGLGKFMNWNGPTMTDSGGFQAFSLGAAYGKNITKFVAGKDDPKILPNRTLGTQERSEKGDESAAMQIAKISHDGVMFKSIIDGSVHYFTPQKSIQIQHEIGADMIFAFDECTSPTEPFQYQAEALDRTHRWAKTCLDYHRSTENASKQALFGIVQGGRFEQLRKESATIIGAMDFDGYGIGGSFAKEDMNSAVRWVNEILPENKPRHLLGIGEPEDLFAAIEGGCDLFDCVLPTRNGRTGTLFTKLGKINIGNAKYKDDFSAIDEGCGCYTCKNYTKAYLSHLGRANEMMFGTLCSIHNLYFIIHLVEQIRQSILDDKFDEFKKGFLRGYKKS